MEHEQAATAGPPAVAGIWHEAVDRGWTISVDPGSGSWKVSSPDRAAGIAFTAPADLGGAGAVNAFDTRRTMEMTGIADPAEAVALVRAFLGWQPGPYAAAPLAAIAQAAAPMAGGR